MPAPIPIVATMLESPRWTVARDICFLATLFVTAGAAPRALPAQDAAPDASAWTVASQPRAIFGQSDDWPGGMFAGIVDVARAPDGTIVVAESQSASVSFFSAEGMLIATEGRQGEGPGEFRRMSALVVDREDRVFVLDQGHQRVSEYTLTGEFVGDAGLVRGASDRPIGGIGQYDDGSWYAWEADRMVGSEMGEMARDTVGYYQFAGGEVGDLLARVPGAITSHFEFQGRGSIRHALLTPRPLGVVRGQCLLLGTSDAPVLHVLDQSGTGVGEVTLDIEVDRTTDEHRRQWASATRAGLSGLAGFIQGFSIRRMSRRVGMAERVPYTDDLVVDELGYLWAQGYELSDYANSAEWLVFTEAGTRIGTVTLPVALQVKEISTDAILGVHTDEHGQQDVRIYALDRGRDIEPRPPLPGCEAQSAAGDQGTV